MQTRNQAKKEINQILRLTTAGLHRDDFWHPVYKALKNIRYAGFDLTVTNTRYGQDEAGNPHEKVWLIEINLPSSRKPIFGIITAHGAGTVNEPLKAYDISAYVS